MSKFDEVEKLKAIIEDPAASDDHKTRAEALLAVYATAVNYALKGGDTEDGAAFGRLYVYLYSDDSLEKLAGIESELRRERAA